MPTEICTSTSLCTSIETTLNVAYRHGRNGTSKNRVSKYGDSSLYGLYLMVLSVALPSECLCIPIHDLQWSRLCLGTLQTLAWRDWGKQHKTWWGLPVCLARFEPAIYRTQVRNVAALVELLTVCTVQLWPCSRCIVVSWTAALSVTVSGDLDVKIIYLLTEQATTAQIYKKNMDWKM